MENKGGNIVKQNSKNLYEKKIKENPYVDGYEESEIDIGIEMTFESIDGEVYRVPKMDLVAGTRGTYFLKVTNNHRDLVCGSTFCFVSLNYNFAFRMQGHDPEQLEYATLESDSGAEFEFIPRPPGGLQNMCKAIVTSGVFKKGESFLIRIGDRRFGSEGGEIYWTETQGRMMLLVDVDGDGRYSTTKQHAIDFNVKAHHKPHLLRLLGPTVARTGESFDLHFGVFDRHGNVIRDYEGEVYFNAPKNIMGIPENYCMKKLGGGIKIFSGVKISEEGVYRIKVTGAGTEKEFTSNPVIVRNNVERYVYWGDIHAHGWGDDTMHLMHLRTDKTDPAMRHEQARRIGRYDFAATGPMSFPRKNRKEMWDAYKAACEDVEEEGRYIPFLAYEAHSKETGGDRNVIFKYYENEELPPDRNASMYEVDVRYGRRNDVLLEAHIGGRTPAWDAYRPERERMIEVASAFGGAEWLLVKALKLGYRPAVCGCSDLHLGLLGGPRTVESSRGRFGRGRNFCSILNRRDAAYGQGPLTAAIAEKLDRETIWKAFEERATYATTGARLYIDFKCNGMCCGRDIERRDIYVFDICCHGTKIIDRIDLICGDYVIQTWEPESEDFTKRMEISDSELRGDWVYLRMHQTDGNYGWTTPFYFKAEYPKWNESRLDISETWDKEAEKHLEDVMNYLKKEEDISKFEEITPAGIINEETTECALFYCYYNGEQEMSIRWYFGYEIPKIRYDWGFRNFGMLADDVMYRNTEWTD